MDGVLLALHEGLIRPPQEVRAALLNRPRERFAVPKADLNLEIPNFTEALQEEGENAIGRHLRCEGRSDVLPAIGAIVASYGGARSKEHNGRKQGDDEPTHRSMVAQ